MSEVFARVALPEDLGLSSKAVLRFFEAHRDLGIHTLAAVRNGKAWAVGMKPWDVDAPHTLFSLSKSFLSMAAGLAVSEGLLSYEDSVADVLADSLPGGYDPKLHEVKLRHLLSMSSGLDEKSDVFSLRMKRDWARAILGHKVQYVPGTRFHYNTMGSYLAGRMVAKRTGMSLRDWLMPRLFAPLGIPKPQWDCCPLGYNTAGFGLHLSCMDIARTAQLILNKGSWGGKRLLPEDYLAQATRLQVDNRNEKTGPDPSDWEQGYGWQFWRARHGRYRGDGMYGQVMMMDEKNNLALAVTAGLNDMGAEMGALHVLMDELASMPPAAKKEQAAIRKLERSLAYPVPMDGGGALFGEGSYEAKGNRLLRLETPDGDTLRVLYRAGGMPLIFTAKRDAPHGGEFIPYAPGERPQPYQGRLGVTDGVITAQVLMPGAPYRMTFSVTRDGGGLRVRMDSVGFDSGTFRFTPAK